MFAGFFSSAVRWNIIVRGASRVSHGLLALAFSSLLTIPAHASQNGECNLSGRIQNNTFYLDISAGTQVKASERVIGVRMIGALDSDEMRVEELEAGQSVRIVGVRKELDASHSKIISHVSIDLLAERVDAGISWKILFYGDKEGTRQKPMMVTYDPGSKNFHCGTTESNPSAPAVSNLASESSKAAQRTVVVLVSDQDMFLNQTNLL